MESTRPLATADQPAALAQLIVKATLEFTGRGPTKARTEIGQDTITVLLEDTLTKGEQALIRSGRGELVITMRRAFQRVMRDRLVEGVEEITGRKVRAFLSDHQLDPDVAVETFVLEPIE